MDKWNSHEYVWVGWVRCAIELLFSKNKVNNMRNAVLGIVEIPINQINQLFSEYVC